MKTIQVSNITYKALSRFRNDLNLDTLGMAVAFIRSYPEQFNRLYEEEVQRKFDYLSEEDAGNVTT